MARDLGVDMGHLAEAAHPGDPLAQARQAAYELTVIINALLLEYGDVTLPESFFERAEHEVAIFEAAPNGATRARLLTAEERTQLRSTQGQAASRANAKTVYPQEPTQ